RRPSARLVGRVPLLGDHTFPALLAGVLHRLGTVTRHQVGNDDPTALRQRLQQTTAVGVLGPQQRSAVEMQDVERPVLDSGGARTVLHLAETRYAGFVERYRFTVEDHVVVGEIGGERFELGVFVG